MSFHFRTFEDMLEVLAESLLPPKRMAVSESAVKHRYMREATHVGPWDNDIAPYLVEPMDELESLDYTGWAFAGPARCGKSDMFFNWLAYATKCDPADMLLVHMTQSTARDWSQGDLRKMLRHSTKVGTEILPGRQSTNTHDVRFKTGMRLLIKWPVITELSGKTVRRVWLMDHDRMPTDIDKEGSPFVLARKRTQTFGRQGMAAAESSPGFIVDTARWLPSSDHEAPPTEGILKIYNTGDRRRWYWRCAACNKPFKAEMDCLSWPEDEDLTPYEMAEQATVMCPHCDFHHTHDADPNAKIPQPGKIGLNKGGKWIKEGQRWEDDGSVTGRARRSDIATFWLQGIAASFVTWRELVFKYINAKKTYEDTGDETDLKAVVNTDFGMPYTPQSMKSDRLPETLKSRALEELGEKVVPMNVRFLTAGIDVQGGDVRGRFEVQVHGHDENGNIYIIDRFKIMKSLRLDEEGDPYPINPKSYEEDWRVLVKEVIEKTYPLADGSGRRMKIKAIACDSHGSDGVTANAYKFWLWLRDKHAGDHSGRFQLIRGNPHQRGARAVLSYPDAERKDKYSHARGEVPVLQLNVNVLKDQLDGMLSGEEGKKMGNIFFPTWLEDWYYSELTAEARDPKKGWINPKNHRNESWDCLVYGLGLMYTARHGSMANIDWERPPSWAKEWDENDMVFLEDAPAPFEAAPKVRYNIGELAAQLA